MKKQARDYSQILILSAILVTVARYIGAFLASDLGEITGWVSDVITILMGFTGLGMGILDVLGGAYIFDGWRRNLPKTGQAWSNRFKVQTVFVFTLFTVGIGILVPFTVSRVQHEAMEGVFTLPWMVWAWSIFVNIAPYLLVGGVVTSQTGVIGIKQDKEQPAQPSAIAPIAKELQGKKKAVFDMLQVTPHATPTQIGMQLGISRQAVSKHIDNLKRDGFLNGNHNHNGKE